MKKLIIPLLLIVFILYNAPIDELNIASANNEEPLKKLEVLSKEDSRINEVIANYQEYPKDLITALSKNIEMLDFVLDYPSKKGSIYGDKIENLKEGEIPLLLQWDEKWGYATYGDNIIAINGCAPTALSMVASSLKQDNTITPYVVSKYAYENSYYTVGVGTNWSLMIDGSKYFGLKSEELSLSKENIYNSLNQGHPIIASMGPGDFTTTGHFIVLTKIEDGKIKVNDPNSIQRSNKLWDYETIESQIKNLWSFSI